MDEVSQKAFVCKAGVCRMSFTNEDHGKKQHEMILNLGITNKAASAFAADQTPTPTRLIKNCEEVGLFDDLKNVNPFEETFRRAVESKSSTPSIPDNLLLSEESLHTPQVFPTFNGSTCTPARTENFNQFKVEKQKLILPDNIAGKEKKLSKKKLFKSRLNISKPANTLPNLSPLLKPILLPTTINLLPTTQVITLSIPATGIKQSRPIPIRPKADIATNCEQSQAETPVKEKLRALLNDQTSSTSTISPALFRKPGKQRAQKPEFLNGIKVNLKEMSNDCMERRRKAAMRYRWKIKKEQVDLKRKNAELTAENIQLKALVKQLKEVLVLHENCGATNRQLNRVPPQNIRAKAAPVQLCAATSVKFIIHNAIVPQT